MNDGQSMSAKEYAFLVLLTLLNVMNFVDRQLLSSFANFIVPDLGLTNTQFGLLTGFAFIIFYAVMGLFMGALADVFHRPRLIAIGLALWSALTAVSGAARGFGSLALPRMFIGVGESALTPTSMSLLSDRFPASRLGFASGFYYMGVPIGVGVSLLVAGYLGPAIGWRGCFYVLGAIGMVLAVVMLFVKETPRRHVAAAAAASPARASTTATRGRGPREIIGTLIQALRFSPALTLTIAGGVAMHFVLGAAAFDQLWYVKERGFERAEIAQMTGWIGMIAGVIGNLVGGVVGDWWLRRTGTGRAMFLFWLGLVLAPFNIAYRMVPGDSPFFWIGIFAGYFGLGAFYGPTFSTVQELVPPQIRATVVAFYILMLNLIGLGVGITAGGWLIDRLIARGVSEPYSVTLVAFTELSLSSTPLFYLAGRRFHRDRERLYAAAAEAAATAA
jgi:MFS transporter, Spinster family, sphingosine-1-phosphate transporter